MNGLPPEAPVLFIDRNSGGRSFKDLLTKGGLHVVLHDEEFSQDTDDEAWLTAVGERGWVVLTGDNATTRSPLFLQRLSRSKALVFVLLALNGATREKKADCIQAAYGKIRPLVETTKGPGLWRVGRAGVVRPFEFRRVLARMQRRLAS